MHLDDEDVNDNQPSGVPTTAEQIRFSKEKDDFRRRYKEQIDQVSDDHSSTIFFIFFQLRSRWQQRQSEIQLLAKRNATEAERQSQTSNAEFRQDYEFIEQSASRERTRLNEIHENHLDTAVNAAKSQANEKLIQAWNETPLKVDDDVTHQQCAYLFMSICQASACAYREKARCVPAALEQRRGYLLSVSSMEQ